MAIPKAKPGAPYPDWRYYPLSEKPAQWALDLVEVVAATRSSIDSTAVAGLTSDKVLQQLRPGLIGLGYDVEGGKTRALKIRRPVLFGDRGLERVAYEVDAVHDSEGVLLEVEAGRGARGNAIYRDLVRTSLIGGREIPRARRHEALPPHVSRQTY